MTDLDTTLAAIDAAISCQHCTAALDEDSPSPDFCSQDCQTAWHATRAQPLVDYREPWWDIALRGVGGDFARWRPPPPHNEARHGSEAPATQHGPRPVAVDETLYFAEQLQRARIFAETRLQLQTEAATRIGEQLSTALAELGRGLQAWAQRVRPVVEQLARVGALPRPRREDPQERALRLVRQRNTGPATRRRAPRRIDPAKPSPRLRPRRPNRPRA